MFSYRLQYTVLQKGSSLMQSLLTETHLNSGEEDYEQRPVEYHTYIATHIQQWVGNDMVIC